MKWPVRIKKELLHVLPIFLFFLVSFTVINWIETYLFEKAGITPYRFLEVALAAALIAKIVLVVDLLPIVSLFRSRPLIYGILWKTGIYWIILFIVRILIRFVPYLLATGMDFESDVTRFIHHANWRLFFSVQAFYLMLLFVFVTFQELTFKIGRKKMRQLFFGKKEWYKNGFFQ